MKTIAEKIKEKGITKTKVADMVEIDNATLSRIIKGKQKFTSTQLIEKIHLYLDNLNTNDKKIFEK